MMILANFPVFADEADVTAWVEAAISLPMSPQGDALSQIYSSDDAVTIVANPNAEDAEVVLTYASGYQSIIAMGLKITDLDGNVVLITDSRGAPQLLRMEASTERPVSVVGKSSISGEWYIMSWLGYTNIYS